MNKEQRQRILNACDLLAFRFQHKVDLGYDREGCLTSLEDSVFLARTYIFVEGVDLGIFISLPVSIALGG